MTSVLHILSRPVESLTQEVIAAQQALPETEVRMIDLNQSEPDYQELLEKIFAADSVQVW